MEEKEVSATSNSASPPGRKAIVLGVVNASEIKCKVDRKRRWDQPPNESESDGPPSKMPYDDTCEFEDNLLENNVRHDDDLLNNDNLEGTPLPPTEELADRLTSPSYPSETLVDKEQIIVQTPSEVLNNLDVNSTFPTTITSSFNELNYSEGNQRVTIEIETVAVTPSSCDDEPKTSIEIVDPNSATVDSLLSKESEGPITSMVDDVNFNIESSFDNASSPQDSEGGEAMERSSIDMESAGNVDPDVMEVILGISSTKPLKPPQESKETVDVFISKNSPDVRLEENLSCEDQSLQHEIEKSSSESIDSKLESSDITSKVEPHLTKMGIRLKALVDYDDYSDESSQQSDKTVQVEPVSKTSTQEVSIACENSLDSKEEEFHDCVEQQTIEESNHDSSSLNFIPLAQDPDDLINNNPSDNDVTYNEIPGPNEKLLALDIEIPENTDISNKIESKSICDNEVDKLLNLPSPSAVSSVSEDALLEVQKTASVDKENDTPDITSSSKRTETEFSVTYSEPEPVEAFNMDSESSKVVVETQPLILEETQPLILEEDTSEALPLPLDEKAETTACAETVEDSPSAALESTSQDALSTESQSIVLDNSFDKKSKHDEERSRDSGDKALGSKDLVNAVKENEIIGGDCFKNEGIESIDIAKVNVDSLEKSVCSEKSVPGAIGEKVEDDSLHSEENIETVKRNEFLDSNPGYKQDVISEELGKKLSDDKRIVSDMDVEEDLVESTKEPMTNTTDQKFIKLDERPLVSVDFAEISNKGDSEMASQDQVLKDSAHLSHQEDSLKEKELFSENQKALQDDNKLSQGSISMEVDVDVKETTSAPVIPEHQKMETSETVEVIDNENNSSTIAEDLIEKRDEPSLISKEVIEHKDDSSLISGEVAENKNESSAISEDANENKNKTLSVPEEFIQSKEKLPIEPQDVITNEDEISTLANEVLNEADVSCLVHNEVSESNDFISSAPEEVLENEAPLTSEATENVDKDNSSIPLPQPDQKFDSNETSLQPSEVLKNILDDKSSVSSEITEHIDTVKPPSTPEEVRLSVEMEKSPSVIQLKAKNVEEKVVSKISEDILVKDVSVSLSVDSVDHSKSHVVNDTQIEEDCNTHKVSGVKDVQCVDNSGTTQKDSKESLQNFVAVNQIAPDVDACQRLEIDSQAGKDVTKKTENIIDKNLIEEKSVENLGGIQENEKLSSTGENIEHDLSKDVITTIASINNADVSEQVSGPVNSFVKNASSESAMEIDEPPVNQIGSTELGKDESDTKDISASIESTGKLLSKLEDSKKGPIITSEHSAAQKYISSDSESNRTDFKNVNIKKDVASESKSSHHSVVKKVQEKLNLSGTTEKPIEVERSMKSSLKDAAATSPLVLASENNSIQSSADLNMECESVDTIQSLESVTCLSAAKEDTELVNFNSVIDISSDSSCSVKKEKSSLSFNLSSINSSKKASEVSISRLDIKNCTIISSDDDNSNIECISASFQLSKQNKPEAEINTDIGNPALTLNTQSEVISVPDSDSSNSKSDSNPKAEIPKKGANVDAGDSVLALSEGIKLASGAKAKLPLTKNETCKLLGNKNPAPRTTRSKAGPETQLTLPKKTEVQLVSNSISSDPEPMEVTETTTEVINASGESIEEGIDDSKNEPITLRIFKDNNALHSESRESPKRPRLDDNSKQLEFTLKISKDASTNIPKATMSPKRTQSPQRLPDPVLPRISSEVSITPVTISPPNSDKKTVKRPGRQGRVQDPSAFETSVEVTLTKTDNSNRVPSVPSHVNNVPEITKTDLNNFNSVSGSGQTSIIGIKDEMPMQMVSPVNSVRGRRGRRGDAHVTPGPPKRRGRPPKRPVEPIPFPVEGYYSADYPGQLIPGETDASGALGGRPVRECRDRTRPILARPRKPRGGGNARGRGGGRGGARVPAIPGREALSAREQEELDRIEARNNMIRLEKLAKREAKLAKKAKKTPSMSEDSPPPPPRELTEEERAELAILKEAEERAAAIAAAAAAEARAIAAREAEKRAIEAAAIKEAEKLAKLAARKERLRELHRMKREKILAKKAAKKLKDEERRKRKAAEKAAEQAAALQSMYEDETRMSAPDGSLRPLFGGDDTPNRNKTGRMEINLSESKEVSVEQLAEYQWECGELYMIQEQVAEYLGVKSFKRKYPDLKRRPVDAEERKYLEDTCLVPKSLCDLGITAVSSAEVLDIMFQDFPDKYEEVRKYLREKQMKEISSKQRALSLYSKQSDKAKADLREQAVECAATWNAHLNRERREERKFSLDLQSFAIHYPFSKRENMKQPATSPGNYPVAVLPGQYCDYYHRYTSNELMYFPLNTVLYGPLKPNERRLLQSDASQSESEESTSSSESSSSDDSDSESEGDEDTKCKICNSCRTSRPDEGGGTSLLSPANNKPEIFLPCTKCKLFCHPSCCKITAVMLPHVRKYNWVCISCKVCVKCNSSDNEGKIRLCDLCDRGFHVSCLDPRKMVPEGNRWHCAVCSFCWSCGAREPGGPSNQWLHEFIKDENGEKVYQRSLCASCCANVGREAAAAVVAAAAAAAPQRPGSPVAGTSRMVSGSVTTSGGISPASSGQQASTSTSTTPVKGYHIVQTKDGSQVKVGNPQVRLALNRSLGSMVVRSGSSGPRGPSNSDSVVVRTPGSTPRFSASPDSVVVRASRGTETQIVVRTPTGVITRPRHNVLISPNNRVDTVSQQTSTININGATNTPKK